MLNVEIENTFMEVFEGLFLRVIITAKDLKWLNYAVSNSTALPSIVMNRTEGGVEKWLSSGEGPDGRVGAIIQFWGKYERKAPQKSLDIFYREVSYRIRQGILVVPTTAIFNAYNSNCFIDTMDRIGHCGDGYEREDILYGRRIIKIPTMMGDFIIERYLGYGTGVMGGNIWLMCTTEDAALEAADRAMKAIQTVEGVITPFGVCSAGSKPETKYPEIGPTTNHPYCPTLRGEIPDSKVPNEVTSIPEIVVNGVSIDAVKQAMKAAILSAIRVAGVVKISAGNYAGKLGQYTIFLRELIS